MSAQAAGRRPGELRFLDPAVLARLGTLELKARAVVEGLLSGLHRSPYKGFSVEFAEYRQYLPGDDLSTIDWKVYARTDRHYVKKFEEETNVDCHLLLDVSASMGYASRGITKLEYGALLASSLAFLMNRQRDAVGLTTFDDAIVTMVPPSARPSHLRSILVTLDQTTLGHRTDVSKPLHLMADGIGKRGLVVMISDLLDEPDRVVDGLRHFRFRGSEVIVFHLMDPAELTFPFERAALFRDLELGDEVMAVPSVVRQEYLDAMQAAVERYKRELGSEGIELFVVSTENRPRAMTPQWLAAHRQDILVTAEAQRQGMPHYTLYLAELARRDPHHPAH